jgi:gliding motility-associated-like protein
LHTSFAQQDKRANVWYFGYNAGIDFNGGTPKALTDSKMSQWEGTASICDQTGKLLLYTNGIQLWNNKHRVVPGAADLGGNDTSTESAIIVPKPGNSNVYYVFTTFKELTCITIDITLNQGEGGVISKNVLMKNSTEKLAAVQHCNKKDFWILAHEAGTNVFRNYLLTNRGLQTAFVESKIGTKRFSSTGYMRFSPKSNKLAIAIHGQSKFELYDFDNASGKISNLVTLVHPDFKMAYGTEFSPDERYLYVTETLKTANRIFQLDIGSKESAEILKSKVTIGQTAGSFFGALKLGPDNKIYVAVNKMNYLGVINEPNLKGVNSGYVSNGLKLSVGTSSIGLPNFVTSFNMEKLSLSIDQEKDCQNIRLTARFLPALSDSRYQWYLDGKVISHADKDTYKPDRSGLYAVVASNKCSDENVYSDTITVTMLKAEPLAVKVSCGIYTLVSNARTPFEWMGESISVSEQNVDSIILRESGTKSYTLKVFEEENPTCYIEKTVTINFGICDANVFVPDIFTPNQDGINDTFKIEIFGGKSSRLDIYTRWGTQIFSSTNASWDGKKEAVECPVGNYIYVLKYKLETGEEYEKRGSVILTR